MYLCQFEPAIKRLKPVLSVPSTFSSVQSVLCVPACKWHRTNWPKLNFSRTSSSDMFVTFSIRQPVSMPKKLENKWWTERRKKRNRYLLCTHRNRSPHCSQTSCHQRRGSRQQARNTTTEYKKKKKGGEKKNAQVKHLQMALMSESCA